MFEKYTEAAIKVIMLSQEEARHMHQNYVGTEQILLGIMGQKYGIGARALRKVKVIPRDVRREIEEYVGKGEGFVPAEIPFTPRAKRLLEMAIYEGRDLGQNYVSTEHILLALISDPDSIAAIILTKLRVDLDKLRLIILTLIEGNQEEVLRPLTETEKFIIERELNGSPTPTLDEYSTNVTKAAIDGKLDPVIGRDEEIFNVIRGLARRRKNNPVLVGEPGVGKTAVAEGLALLVLSDKIPDFLIGCSIMALDLGAILAGTKYRGEFEERLKLIVEEVEDDPSVVVLIDEIHTLVGAGAAEGAVDAANILKPALARGKFRCIGATTIEEYRKYIERDPALERRFIPVKVEEPTVGVTIQILRGLRSKFEQHHMLSYHEKALEQSAILSDKYIMDRYLPDKAIDILDEAGSRVRLENRSVAPAVRDVLKELQDTLRDKETAIKTNNFTAAQQLVDHEMEVRTHLRILKKSALTDESLGVTRKEVDMVTEDDIAAVVANWTGIPLTKLTGSEQRRLLTMEDTLHERLIGQEEAVTAVSKAIRRSRVGLRNPNRPIASFIFAGPTGVGKTELTKALTHFMFGDEDNMVRLDMSEFMEKHTVAKLIGSPPGYVGYSEGGQLTEALRTKPYSVVLFDEVEKAHPDVFNLLLQILDDGRLTDSKGRLIDFKNALIIMTTNLGAKVIEQESGVKSRAKQEKSPIIFVDDDPEQLEPPKPELLEDNVIKKVTELVNDELKEFFRPEFLNRIDDIIVFTHLNKYDLWKISGILIKQVADRLKETGIILDVDPAVRNLITEQGYDPIYGARPLRRSVTKYLEDALAEQCLSQVLHPNTKIKVRRKIEEGDAKTKYRDYYLDDIQIEVDQSSVDPYEIKKYEEELERQKILEQVAIEKEREKAKNKKI